MLLKTTRFIWKPILLPNRKNLDEMTLVPVEAAKNIKTATVIKAGTQVSPGESHLLSKEK
jgi:hypothetical protein